MPFGETVMFKIPKTSQAVGSLEERWESGVWIGTTIRDGMSLIGTTGGVYKVGVIKRKPDGEQWSQDMVKNIVGSPQQPQPGVGTRRITTFAKKKLEVETAGLPVQFQPPTDAPPVPRNVRILKIDVDKHGPTPGCPGCRAAAGGKNWRTAHTADCRTRMEALMKTDEDGKRRLDLANETMAHHIVNMGAEVAEEEDSKKRRLDSSRLAAERSEGPVPEADRMPDDTLPSVRAAMGGKDASPAAVARKRRAEEEPDDPRS